jgi:hypothetical protein
MQASYSLRAGLRATGRWLAPDPRLYGCFRKRKDAFASARQSGFALLWFYGSTAIREGGFAPLCICGLTHLWHCDSPDIRY